MAGSKKKQPQTAAETPRPARRSTRIASRANSEAASSIAGDEDHVEAPSANDGAASKRKTISKKKMQSAPACIKEEEEDLEEFTPGNAVLKIMGGDHDYIHKLTLDQKDEVIKHFVRREHRFHEKLDEMEEEIEELTQQRDEAKSNKQNLRDRLFQEDMARRTIELQQKQKQKAEEEEEKARQAAAVANTSHTKDAETSANDSTPPAPTENDMDDTMGIDDFTEMSLIQSTPLPRPTQAVRAQTEPKPRSFFGTLLKTFTFQSPFTRSVTPTTPTQEKLGDLPTSRKRAAPAQEPKTEPHQAVQPQQQPAPYHPAPQQPATQHPARIRNTTAPRTPATAQPRRQPASAAAHFHTAEPTLGTITEYSEPTEDSIVGADPTPSRPPPIRSTNTQPTIPRHREISVMRRSMMNPRTTTPSRAWDPPKPQPREPNADRRLEKLRRFRELDGQLQAMKEDPETRDIIERPLKRVKVDELASIPHNRPGDAPSTFRVPDVDSEDEMEIDEEDSVLRSNVFDPTEEITPRPRPGPKEVPEKSLFDITPQKQPDKEPAKVQAPPKAAEKLLEQPQKMTEEPPALVLNLAFPEIAKLPPGQENITNHVAGAKFEYGFKVWQLTGELVPGLYGM